MITIYHNPRCSKSRQTLKLIEDAGLEPEVIRYLDTPPDKDTLKSLIRKLGISARELIRRKEEAYKVLRLADDQLTEDELIDAMLRYPALIERPIVVRGEKAVIGRPPENVEALLGTSDA